MSQGQSATAVTPYSPMTLTQLAGYLGEAGVSESERWRLIAEFLEEYRWEPLSERHELVADEPPPAGDERWDVFLAALAEHVTSRDGKAPPAWADARVLERFWFPFNTAAARVDAFVHAPASFRRRGIFVAGRELEVA